MNTTLHIGLIFITFLKACGQESSQQQSMNQDMLTKSNLELKKKEEAIINPTGQTLITRILTPSGFDRMDTYEKSFTEEIQILKNPDNDKISPWYSINFGEELETPEWTFNKTDLKRFEEEHNFACLPQAGKLIKKMPLNHQNTKSRKKKGYPAHNPLALTLFMCWVYKII